jgi:hypothetical protein
LTRRGCTLTAAAAAALLTQRALAADLPAELVGATVRAALTFIAGKTATAGALSAPAVALAEGVLRIMWLNKLTIWAAVVLFLAVSGTGLGLLARQAWAGTGPDVAAGVQDDPPVAKPKADGPVPAPGSKTDVAALRAEVVKLRAELDAAVKEIRQLKEALRQPRASANQRAVYRGKPLSFWLDQTKDADAKYRAEAVEAIGALAQSNNDLIAVVAAHLKDPDLSVGSQAAASLVAIGKPAIPMLRESLQEKSRTMARINAADALAKIGPDAQSVPLLRRALNDTHVELRWAALKALGRAGPAAWPALPDMVNYLRDWIGLAEAHIKMTGESPIFFNAGRDFATAFIGIDPDVRDLLPREIREALVSAAPRRGDSIDLRVINEMHALLRKRYSAKTMR